MGASRFLVTCVALIAIRCGGVRGQIGVPRGNLGPEEAFRIAANRPNPPPCNCGASVATAVIITLLICAGLAGALCYFFYRKKATGLKADPESLARAAYDNPRFEHDHCGASTEKEKARGSVADGASPNNLTPTRTTSTNTTATLERKKFALEKVMSAFMKNSRIYPKKSKDDSCMEPRDVIVPLEGHDFTGLGFSFHGNLKEGLYVKDLMVRGPASQSGLVCPGDRIVAVTVLTNHIVFEDAQALLSYASPYPILLHLQKDVRLSSWSSTSSRSKLNKSSPSIARDTSHPSFRSISQLDLSKIEKHGMKSLSFKSFKLQSKGPSNKCNEFAVFTSNSISSRNSKISNSESRHSERAIDVPGVENKSKQEPDNLPNTSPRNVKCYSPSKDKRSINMELVSKSSDVEVHQIDNDIKAKKFISKDINLTQNQASDRGIIENKINSKTKFGVKVFPDVLPQLKSETFASHKNFAESENIKFDNDKEIQDNVNNKNIEGVAEYNHENQKLQSKEPTSNYLANSCPIRLIELSKQNEIELAMSKNLNKDAKTVQTKNDSTHDIVNIKDKTLTTIQTPYDEELNNSNETKKTQHVSNNQLKAQQKKNNENENQNDQISVDKNAPESISEDASSNSDEKFEKVIENNKSKSKLGLKFSLPNMNILSQTSKTETKLSSEKSTSTDKKSDKNDKILTNLYLKEANSPNANVKTNSTDTAKESKSNNKNHFKLDIAQFQIPLWSGKRQKITENDSSNEKIMNKRNKNEENKNMNNVGTKDEGIDSHSPKNDSGTLMNNDCSDSVKVNDHFKLSLSNMKIPTLIDNRKGSESLKPVLDIITHKQGEKDMMESDKNTCAAFTDEESMKIPEESNIILKSGESVISNANLAPECKNDKENTHSLIVNENKTIIKTEIPLHAQDVGLLGDQSSEEPYNVCDSSYLTAGVVTDNAHICPEKYIARNYKSELNIPISGIISDDIDKNIKDEEICLKKEVSGVSVDAAGENLLLNKNETNKLELKNFETLASGQENINDISCKKSIFLEESVPTYHHTKLGINFESLENEKYIELPSFDETKVELLLTDYDKPKVINVHNKALSLDPQKDDSIVTDTKAHSCQISNPSYMESGLPDEISIEKLNVKFSENNCQKPFLSEDAIYATGNGVLQDIHRPITWESNNSENSADNTDEVLNLKLTSSDTHISHDNENDRRNKAICEKICDSSQKSISNMENVENNLDTLNKIVPKTVLIKDENACETLEKDKDDALFSKAQVSEKNKTNEEKNISKTHVSLLREKFNLKIKENNISIGATEYDKCKSHDSQEFSELKEKSNQSEKNVKTSTSNNVDFIKLFKLQSIKQNGIETNEQIEFYNHETLNSPLKYESISASHNEFHRLPHTNLMVIDNISPNQTPSNLETDSNIDNVSEEPESDLPEADSDIAKNKIKFTLDTPMPKLSLLKQNFEKSFSNQEKVTDSEIFSQFCNKNIKKSEINELAKATKSKIIFSNQVPHAIQSEELPEVDYDLDCEMKINTKSNFQLTSHKCLNNDYSQINNKNTINDSSKFNSMEYENGKYKNNETQYGYDKQECKEEIQHTYLNLSTLDMGDQDSIGNKNNVKLITKNSDILNSRVTLMKSEPKHSLISPLQSDHCTIENKNKDGKHILSPTIIPRPVIKIPEKIKNEISMYDNIWGSESDMKKQYESNGIEFVKAPSPNNYNADKSKTVPDFEEMKIKAASLGDLSKIREGHHYSFSVLERTASLDLKNSVKCSTEGNYCKLKVLESSAKSITEAGESSKEETLKKIEIYSGLKSATQWGTLEEMINLDADIETNAVVSDKILIPFNQPRSSILKSNEEHEGAPISNIEIDGSSNSFITDVSLSNEANAEKVQKSKKYQLQSNDNCSTTINIKESPNTIKGHEGISHSDSNVVFNGNDSIHSINYINVYDSATNKSTLLDIEHNYDNSLKNIKSVNDESQANLCLSEPKNDRNNVTITMVSSINDHITRESKMKNYINVVNHNPRHIIPESEFSLYESPKNSVTVNYNYDTRNGDLEAHNDDLDDNFFQEHSNGQKSMTQITLDDMGYIVKQGSNSRTFIMSDPEMS